MVKTPHPEARHTVSDATIFIPSLNEPPLWIARIAELLVDAARRSDVNPDVVIFDAGSKLESVIELKDVAGRLSRQGMRVRLIGAGLCAKPNKNLGISYCSNLSDADRLVIADADWGAHVYEAPQIFLTLFDRNADLIVPEPSLGAGRDNLLLGGPILRCWHPALYKIIKTPFPGLCSVNNRLLSSVIRSKYNYDWGGELDILLGCSRDLTKLQAPSIPFIPARHRSLDSKVVDAYHIFRSALLRAGGRSPLQHSSPDHLKKRYPAEYSLLAQYCIGSIGITASNLINTISALIRLKHTKSLYRQLISTSQTHNLPELGVLAEMTIRPLSKLILNQEISGTPISDATIDYNRIPLRSISLLSDIIIISFTNHLNNVNTKGSFGDVSKRIKDYSPYTEALTARCMAFPFGVDIFKLSYRELDCYCSLHNAIGPTLLRTDAMISVLGAHKQIKENCPHSV